MNKYLVLYHAPKSALAQMAQATPEQAKAGMDMWMAWSQSAGKSIVDMGAPLGSTSAIGGTPAASEAALGGYGIVQAESMAAARKLFEAHPHLRMPGGWIELLELVKLPGM